MYIQSMYREVEVESCTQDAAWDPGMGRQPIRRSEPWRYPTMQRSVYRIAQGQRQPAKNSREAEKSIGPEVVTAANLEMPTPAWN